MWSDSEDDGDLFDYASSQNYSDIDYQIDLFERHQSIKRDKYWKQKRNPLLCPLSTKKLQSHAMLLKISCKRYKQKGKINQKTFGYQTYASVSKRFECDKEFLVESTKTESTKPVKKDPTQFSSFRAQFYQKNHQNIKSSFKNRSDVKIINIRPAPVDQLVRIEFMRRLNENDKTAPQLVYHGTSLRNIASILRFGFLVPNQAHPTRKNVPIIRSRNGQAYGQGIYCSRIARYSLSYTQTASTLLVCAAIPNCDRMGKFAYFNGYILVLPDGSQIIPLFLLDLCLADGLGCESHWYPPGTLIERERIQKEKQPMNIPKQILRRILGCVNNRVRKTQRYQIRLFN